MAHKSPVHICLIAGEASGDALGAPLMKALRAENPHINFSGIGGNMMQGQGMKSLFPITDLSVMGLAEVLPRLPLLMKRISETAKHIIDTKPDIVVTIDSPDFSTRVIRRVREGGFSGAKFIHYVAPTVWAWRPERAAKFAKLYDGMICLFPFEPPYFEREGMKASFAGHSMIEIFSNLPGREESRRILGIPQSAKILGTFFGSRIGELNRMGPVIRDAAIQMAKDNRDLYILAPTLPHLEREVSALLLQMPCHVKVISDAAHKPHAFAALDLAIATSGTVGLELAVADVPHVIGYRVNRLTYEILRRKVKVSYAHLVNLLLDRRAVPEFLQHDCTPRKMADALRTIDITQQKAAFAQARQMLSGNGKGLPSQQASAFIQSFLN